MQAVETNVKQLNINSMLCNAKSKNKGKPFSRVRLTEGVKNMVFKQKYKEQK